MDRKTILYMTRLGELELEKFYDGKRECNDSLMAADSLTYGPDTIEDSRRRANSDIKDSERKTIYFDEWRKIVKKSIDDGYISTFKHERVDEHI